MQTLVYKSFFKVNFLTPNKTPPNEIKNNIGKNSNVWVLPISVTGLPITASVLINSSIKLDCR
ncbi:hypothetical protein P3J6_120452 [Pseudoalteromonas sp. 3J6]|nr:hypothetical protein P3J6_120452 [Pseudoalteromonas sp. 3J6]